MKEIAPDVLDAIRNETAGATLRRAYAQQLASAMNAPLRGGDVTTQTDFTQPTPTAANGQTLFF